MQLMCSIQQVISRSSTPTLTRNHQFNFISLQSHFRGYSARKGIPSPTDTATPGSGQGKLVNKPSSELQTVSGMSTWELPLYKFTSTMPRCLAFIVSQGRNTSYFSLVRSFSFLSYDYRFSISFLYPPSLPFSLPSCMPQVPRMLWIY